MNNWREATESRCASSTTYGVPVTEKYLGYLLDAQWFWAVATFSTDTPWFIHHLRTLNDSTQTTLVRSLTYIACRIKTALMLRPLQKALLRHSAATSGELPKKLSAFGSPFFLFFQKHFLNFERLGVHFTWKLRCCLKTSTLLVTCAVSSRIYKEVFDFEGEFDCQWQEFLS